MEHRTDERFLEVAHAQLGCELTRHHAAEVAGGDVILEVGRLRLVLQVLEQHQRQCGVAHLLEAQDRDRARDGGNRAAELLEIGGIDHAQELVGQRHILEDAVGQRVASLVFGGHQIVDRRDGRRQHREIALVAHAAQQEIERATVATAGRRCLLRLRIGVFGERRQHRGRAGIARQRVFFQRPHDDRFKLFIDRLVARRGPGEGLLDDRVHGLVMGRALHRRGPGEHFVEHHAGGEHVAARRECRARQVFGRHVAGGAGEALLAGLAGFSLGVVAGDAEIHHARHALARDHDVGRLQVAMHHAGFVRIIDAGQKPAGDAYRVVRRHATAVANQVAERLAFDILEHQVGHVGFLAGIEQRHDVRV